MKIFPPLSRLILAAFISLAGNHTLATEAAAPGVVAELADWLVKNPDFKALADQPFATKALTKEETAATRALLWEAYADQLHKASADDWRNGVVKSGDLSMKFLEKSFGTKPAAGWPLFISMHGGGNAPAGVNDSQWQNQIKLYQPADALYIAPRAPTNDWNLWHEPNIDTLFDRLIAEAIAFKGVDPNRVYLMGYSAGGDGVYQLAPRMADRFAAAAMMAGHPNDASPLGLRNLPFTIHVGGDDAAYNRNNIAKEWGKKLDDLRAADPKGYEHETVIHAGLPHWMNREDAVAVPWMAKFTRNPIPEKIVWKQAGRTHERFYWLAVPPGKARAGSLVVARREGQTFHIEDVENVEEVGVYLDDRMADLDKPITITFMVKPITTASAKRTIAAQWASLQQHGDPAAIFSSSLVSKDPGHRHL